MIKRSLAASICLFSLCWLIAMIDKAANASDTFYRGDHLYSTLSGGTQVPALLVYTTDASGGIVPMGSASLASDTLFRGDHLYSQVPGQGNIPAQILYTTDGSGNVVPVGSVGDGAGMTALTGDVTATGAGSVVTSVVKIRGISVKSGTPSDGQVLTYNATATRWEAAAAGAGADASSIQGEAVAASTPNSGDVLTYNGTFWEPAAPSGGTPTLTSLTDGTALPASGLVSGQFKTFGSVTLTAGTWAITASAGVFNGATGAPTTLQICLSELTGNTCTGALAIHTLGLVTHNFPTPSTCGSACWVDYIAIPNVIITVGGSITYYLNVQVQDANIADDQVGGYIRAFQISP